MYITPVTNLRQFSGPCWILGRKGNTLGPCVGPKAALWSLECDCQIPCFSVTLQSSVASQGLVWATLLTCDPVAVDLQHSPESIVHAMAGHQLAPLIGSGMNILPTLPLAHVFEWLPRGGGCTRSSSLVRVFILSH